MTTESIVSMASKLTLCAHSVTETFTVSALLTEVSARFVDLALSPFLAGILEISLCSSTEKALKGRMYVLRPDKEDTLHPSQVIAL